MKQASVFNEICGVYYMIRSSYASKYIALPWYAHFYGINLKPVPLFGNYIFLDVGSFIKKKRYFQTSCCRNRICAHCKYNANRLTFSEITSTASKTQNGNIIHRKNKSKQQQTKKKNYFYYVEGGRRRRWRKRLRMDELK